MTETATTDEMMKGDPDAPKTIPLAYLVTRGKSAVIVQGVVQEASNPGDLSVQHWVLRNQGLNPLAFATGEEVLANSTWATAEEAIEAAGLFVEAWEQMRDLALAADDMIRNLDLPGRQQTGRPSAFPPGVGGEIIQ